MKVVLECLKCVDEQGKLLGDTMVVEMQDNGLYRVTCSKSHESLVFVPTPKHEILFQLGALALLDGHTREAVSSIAVALERFYEFYVKVVSTKYNLSPPEFDRCWKMVSKQSERQLGAFLFLYLFETKRAAQFINNKFTEFRNEITHKGKICSYDEAVEYGVYVMNIIKSVTAELRATDNESVGRVLWESAPKEWDEAPESVAKVLKFLPTILEFPNNVPGVTNFREALEAVKRRRAENVNPKDAPDHGGKQ
jgi:hypothetical protein